MFPLPHASFEGAVKEPTARSIHPSSRSRLTVPTSTMISWDKSSASDANWEKVVLMRSIAGFIAAGLALAASPVQACKGKNVQFTDDFRQVDSSWGVDPDAVSVEDGKVKIKADPTTNYVVLYKGPKFTDADLCVTIQIPVLFGSRSRLSAGPVFWAENNDAITPSSLSRMAAPPCCTPKRAASCRSSISARLGAPRPSRATRMSCV